MRCKLLLAALLVVGPVGAPLAAGFTDLRVTDPVDTTALAVARTPGGGVRGASASISVSVAPNGSGHVFVETRPLTGLDMQGSARIAARVAASVTGYGFHGHDFFFTVRSDSPVISGPSAGAELATAAIAALENAHRDPGQPRWNVSETVMATGTINPDGSIGPVGGILTKARAAAEAGARLFLVPEGQDPYQPRLRPVAERFGRGPVNVSAYCREELDVTCREVGTIEELVAEATGHRFPRPEVGEPPTTAPYEDTLAPLSQRLIGEAERVHETWEKLNESDLDGEEQGAVRESIQQALDPLRRARQHWGEDRFYSAASMAFQASIRAREARLRLTFFQEGRSLDHVESVVEDAAGKVESVRARAGNATVEGIQDVYTVGAAQERVSGAESRVRQARQALNATEIRPALYNAAFARERARTVEWWLSLADEFGTGPELPRNVSGVAREFVDLGDELIAYAGSVTGQGPPDAARDRLDRAKRDRDRGFHAAALLEAAEAQVLATLPLELRGEPAPQAVNESRREAVEAIERTRGRGIEPVLPVAMFEFARSQPEPGQAIRLFRQARVLAGLSGVLTSGDEPGASPFLEEDGPDPGRSATEQPAPSPGEDAEGAQDHGETASPTRRFAVGWTLVGAFGALALGLVGRAAGGRDG